MAISQRKLWRKALYPGEVGQWDEIIIQFDLKEAS